MLAYTVPLVHLTVTFLSLSFLVFDPWKIDYLLNLACGVFASMGPRNVYKDMLNNMVSPIDHVVMNHQNQTRTNGKWGPVRYRPLFGTLFPSPPLSCSALKLITLLPLYHSHHWSSEARFTPPLTGYASFHC
jgi:hypothetical protein